MFVLVKFKCGSVDVVKPPPPPLAPSPPGSWGQQ